MNFSCSQALPPAVTVRCPFCAALHAVAADVAPTRPDRRTRVPCESCGRRETREVALPCLETSARLAERLKDRNAYRRRRERAEDFS